MPYPLDTHVLTVDTNVINKVDTSNPQNLYSMWTVFAKCAESVEQGRRLENLSWRLWNRETFSHADDEEVDSVTTTSVPREIPRASRMPDIPQLSGSVESENDDEEAVDLTSLSAPLEIRPRIKRLDSCTSNRSRGKDRRISSGNFEKMVVSIIKENEPLSAPLPRITPSYVPPQKETPDLPPISPVYDHSGSTTTESPCKSSEGEEEYEKEHVPPPPSLDHIETTTISTTTTTTRPTTFCTTVVHGFSPVRITVEPCPTAAAAAAASLKTPSPAPIPEPRSSPVARPVQSKKQPMFSIGESCSSSEHERAMQKSRPTAPAVSAAPSAPKRKMLFHAGASSEEESSPKSALAGASSHAGSLTNGQSKKTASFADQMSTRLVGGGNMMSDSNSAIADDSDTDYVDESAIDDDDDDESDWEDSVEDSNKSSIDDKTFFQRVDSKVNLTSRRSLITLMIEQNSDRNKKPAAAAAASFASQSTSALPWTRTSGAGPPTMAVSPNDSDDAPLMMKRGARPSPLKPITEVPRSAAQPIQATASHAHLHAALSPRTTRRNMLATELTESLRRNLLWERQQKSSTANAVLKRRHTAHDVANLKQYPEKVCLKKEDDPSRLANNNPPFFSKDTDNFGGYHSKGW